jgi:CBS domain-containing protein
MSVRDVMTTRVAYVRESASVKEIAARLREQRVSAFPVLDGEDKVIGVVSEADLLTKEALDAAVHRGFRGLLRRRERAKVEGTTAADVMTTPPLTIGPDEPVTSAARLMYSCRVKRLPVTNADGRLVGIVSRSDVLAVYGRPDEDIRRDISEGVILDRHLCDPARFRVAVQEGVVTIEGSPETGAVGRDIVEEARRVEGVVAVHDRLSYPPPTESVPATPLF